MRELAQCIACTWCKRTKSVLHLARLAELGKHGSVASDNTSSHHHGFTMHTGSCLCGAVQFEVDGALPAPDACHCKQCRKWTGHLLASSDVPRSSLTVHGAEHVTWFHSSAKVRRGFCGRCGSSLFFDPLDRTKHDWIGVAMGAFDGPTGTRLGVHIHVDSKGDYYEIADSVAQRRN